MNRVGFLSRLTVSLLVIALGVVVCPSRADAATSSTKRVSVSSSGKQAKSKHSGGASISANGRYVAFYSDATNLVAGDTNKKRDVFVRDRTTGKTTRASVSSSGKQGNGVSSAPSISANGRYVAFHSNASNLVTGDTNKKMDVFVRDRTTGATTRISVATGGAQCNGASSGPSISADGRYVAFESMASNLVANDVNEEISDVFVHDRMLNTTIRVSTTKIDKYSALDGPFSASFSPSISADGRYVAFVSSASDLVPGDTNKQSDVFVYDITTGKTTRVSVASKGTQGRGGFGSYSPSISANGRYVAFSSWASNLVSKDSNKMADVFVHDRVTRKTTRVSVSSAGKQGKGGHSGATSISSDGRYVAFGSATSNLVARDTNKKADVFVHDRKTKKTTRVSVSSAGKQGNGLSESPTISANGGYVAFESKASNLVSKDTNKAYDVFARRRGTAAKKTTLALSTKSNSKLGYGKTFKVTGTLKKSGKKVAATKVVLQSAAPGKAFKNTSKTKKTTAKGAFSFSVKPSSKTRYRVKAGSTVSKTVTATPKVSLGTPVAPETMAKDTTVTVSGSLKPRHAAGTTPVRIYKYKKVGSTWKSMGYVKAKATNYKTYTRYKASVKLPSTGTWRLRAYAPADSKHAATWSAKYDTVKVK